MPTRRFPLVTLGLLLAMTSLHFLVTDKTPLYFSAADIARGEVWRLVTGHLVHVDLEHLFWNGLALGILGLLIERRSGALLWISLGVGIASVNLLLLSPFAQLHFYCGLSGVLNTLIVVVLWLEWRATHSILVVAIAVGCILKVAIEIYLGTALVTNISWPSYSWSHLAGLLGGLIVVPGLSCLQAYISGREGSPVNC